MRIKAVFVCLLTALILACSQKDSTSKPEGPYFGNGFHNGWADQESIVIWTRLTKEKEGNVEGQQFLSISKDEMDLLDENPSKEKIHSAQIPQGFDLDDMEGACPGSPGEVKLTYFPINQPDKKMELPWVAVNNDENYTHQWQLEGLTADTEYQVIMEARGGSETGVSDKVEGKFYLPPKPDQQKEISFTVVSCHDYLRKDQPDGHQIYRSMLKLDPDFYVHTGDIEYYDKQEPWAMTEELMRFKWDRLFALPLQREFWAQNTSYFMKDDHDALRNDAYPGMSYGTVSWERGLEIFDQEQFPSNEKPYETIRWGKDLQIWITEGRNYRSRNTDPDQRGKTIWGEVQKQWLFDTMKESDATFKVLITNDPILGPDRENKSDNYANSNFKYEGDEIRDFLNQFENTFITCGDRHWQYVTHYEDTNLWEFGSGSGADQHAGGWKQEDVRPEHRFLRVKGGYLFAKVFQADGKPAISFQHHDVDGNMVHEEVFYAN
ncbi:MAG: alkaline phosphatase D family protein [Cyclobacteriaceae bacterium]